MNTLILEIPPKLLDEEINALERASHSIIDLSVLDLAPATVPFQHLDVLGSDMALLLPQESPQGLFNHLYALLCGSIYASLLYGRREP